VASSGLIVGLLIITLFFKTTFVYNLISGIFSLLLASYLIVDTQLILKGKHPALNFDDAITGAMILYSDLANLFMYTLVRIG
jgi:FtsH-binding integral membrane protein